VKVGEQQLGYKSFKEKYDTDQEFRDRHRKYVLEKVKCTCGCMVARSNLSSHQKRKKHLDIINTLIAQGEEMPNIDNLMNEEDIEKCVVRAVNKALKLTKG